MVLLHTRMGTLAAGVFAVLLALHLRGSVAPLLAQGWLVLKLLVSAARVLLALRYARVADAAATSGNATRWRRWTLGLLALDGLVWGAAGFALMAQPVPVASLVVAALDGVSCVATFGLQASLAATAAYTVPMLLPLAIGLALRGDDIAAFTAIGQLLLLALQLHTAHGTAQRLASTVLLRLQAQQLVAEKDAALQLARAQSALRTQFLAKVSHELRTPLHGMLGMARLLHLESADTTVTHRLELIEASGTHLLGLINDLLDVARIDSDHFTLRLDNFDLSALIDQAGEVFTLRAADKGLRFTLQLALPRPHWVRGDAARVRQVLNNLLGNAVKFTREGGITLEAGFALAGTAGSGHSTALPDRVCLTVHDTGDGIGAHERARIFQAFHQAADGAHRPTEGVGLGLTIARELAVAMGGDITVRSAPGQGASFSFTARLVPAADSGPGAGANSGPVQRLPGLVLVVEDDEVNAMIVGAFLDSLGVRCERVADGKQAVARALRETNRPDLVLMDYRMPVMDGPTAAAEIRRQELTLGLPRLPIVALTATSTDTDRQACLDAGMDEVISKPFTPAQLAQALRGAGRRRPAAAPTARPVDPASATLPPAAADRGARFRP